MDPKLHIFLYTLVFLMGINIGSFLNVCIYRIPLGKNIAKGRSYCPNCQSLIPFYCNIPLLSYMALGGKCKDCKSPISPIYPIVELLNGLLYLLVFFVHGFGPYSIVLSLALSILLIISFIDQKYQIIPDSLVVSLLVLSLINLAYQLNQGKGSWQAYLLGFFAASLPLLILGLIYEDGLGGGDIKLMAASGLLLGWKLILLGLFLGNLVALTYVAILFFQKKAKKGTAIAFGPFLSIGILISMVFGDPILAWYLAKFF